MEISSKVDGEAAKVCQEICSEIIDFMMAQVKLNATLCEKIGFNNIVSTIVHSLFVHDLLENAKIDNQTLYEQFKSLNLDTKIKEISDEIERGEKNNA